VNAGEDYDHHYRRKSRSRGQILSSGEGNIADYTMA
jgi:hypothetical protein